PLLDGRAAAAWNATFDARVLDEACFAPAGYGRGRGVRWWDAQLADALLHAGMTGFGWYHGLAWAAEAYLGVEADGKGTVQLSYDGVSDLSEEQVSYAASDAVLTLWVADVLRERVAAEGLAVAAELEMAARPLLDHLQRGGVLLDGPGYRTHLGLHRRALEAALDDLATMTGGGQGNLFSPVAEPSWNPASEAQAKQALNRWSAPEVASYTEAAFGASRPLAEHDRLDAATLRDIGGPLAERLLEHRHHHKLLTAYGDNLAAHVGEDGRFHPQYVQVVGVNTGRLASRNPNVQAFPPELQAFLVPASADRVFVHADVSQAELRWLAQVAGDRVLAAELAGGDVHAATAGALFGCDMASLAIEEPSRFADLRARAKAINFGIVYGQGGAGLARALGRGGAEVSVGEANALLEAYATSHPGVAAWFRSQDAVVEAVAARAGEVDWPRTLKLYDDLASLGELRRNVRDRTRRWPSASEVRAALPEVAESSLWRPGAVLLDGAGSPLSWETRTLGGRRRWFTIATSSVLRRVALAAAGSPLPGVLRDAWRTVAAAHGLVAAQPDGSPLAVPVLERVFEDRRLRRDLVGHLLAGPGVPTVVEALRRGVAGAVRNMANAHRNAPIQGGVADGMLAAYGELWSILASEASWAPVLTVHDSLVVECPADDAGRAGTALLDALRRGFGRFCPDVPLAVDLDVRTSLADASVVERYVTAVA
ncbi:MAG: DNA polymerase, partial [Acidimicrobiia bacterium]|nr:DNA polymerase [Acidimicrobiia bacterium]